jgi:hypothetical protein
MKVYPILLFTICLICACAQEEPECGDPERYYCIIELVDSEGNYVIGQDKIYQPDSVFFLINETRRSTYISSGKIIWTYAALDQFNHTDYILHLSSSETDTLNLFIDRVQGRCFDSFSIDRFMYNDVLILPHYEPGEMIPVYKVVVSNMIKNE